MSLHVSFQMPAFAGSNDIGSIGSVRASEAIAADATGSLTAEDGEIAFICNTGTSVLYIAHGSTPDASATTKTPATSARYAIPSGLGVVPVRVYAGDKFAVASS